MNFHYDEMYELIDNVQPTGTDVIASVEVGYSTFPDVQGNIRQRILHGWYADKVNLDISSEEAQSLPDGGG